MAISPAFNEMDLVGGAEILDTVPRVLDTNDSMAGSEIAGSAQAGRIPSALSVIRRFSIALKEWSSSEDICKGVVETVGRETSAENCSLMTLDKNSQRLVLRAAKGRQEAACSYYEGPNFFCSFKMGHGVAGWVAQQQRSLLIGNANQDERFEKSDHARVAVKSLCCLPIVFQDKTLGVINLSHPKEGAFSEDEICLLEVMADAVALAMARLQISLQLEKLSQGQGKKGLERDKNLDRENRKLSETTSRLIQSEKLACIGELVAGVSHELNNPLTSVLGYSQLLLEKNCNSGMKDTLAKICGEAKRCHKIVQNLLSFARRYEPEMAPVNINEILENTVDLCGYQLAVDNIDICLRLTDSIPATIGDSHQLKQVFLNIITNAHQAMSAQDNGGCLTIETTQCNGSIRISFTDTGPGISAECLETVFEPFFTTKESGTGLGLSLSAAVIRDHGGQISARSSLGQGATFRVELPVKEVTSTGRFSSNRAVTHQHETSGRLLVVDDEKMIRELLCEILSAEGYTVEAVDSAGAAINKLLSHRYDLVLTDLKMAGMGGQGLYYYIKEKSPRDVKRVVFMTGDTVSDETRAFIESTDNKCLSKPFEINELRSTLDDAMSVV